MGIPSEAKPGTKVPVEVVSSRGERREDGPAPMRATDDQCPPGNSESQ